MRASLVAQMVKHLPAVQETWVWSLGWEDPLEKEMATHSNTLAWKIPWAEEPGGLQSMGSRRVRQDWATSLSLSPWHWFLWRFLLMNFCSGELWFPVFTCLSLQPMDLRSIVDFSVYSAFTCSWDGTAFCMFLICRIRSQKFKMLFFFNLRI